MALIVRNDEQIQVGVTPGLIAGSSSFTFDGLNGTPDYRQFEIVISELNGRGIMDNMLDYSWDARFATFQLLQDGDFFAIDQVYNVHFQALEQPRQFDYQSLINSGFFIRDINLTNLTEGRVLQRLNFFIDKYEKECLIKILGWDLFKVLISETSDRVTAIIYGDVYNSPSGFQRYWEGLIHDTNISLLANYVYYYYQSANALQTTGVGTKSSKPEAGTAESPIDKMISAWQFFASEVRLLCSFLWNKTFDDIPNGVRLYPEFTPQLYNNVMHFARRGAVNKFGF